MFHIHNVQEEWTEFAISLTIKRIIDEMGKKFKDLNSDDIKELSKITSLSEYKVRKYLKFLDYPDEVIEMFLTSEIESKKGDEGPDPDILLEMHRPIKDLQEVFPEFIEKFPVKRIIDACIIKKEENIIRNNKEFRMIAQSLTAAKKNEINQQKLLSNLQKFILNVDYTPEKLFHETAESLYQFKHLVKSSETFIDELESFDFQNLDDKKYNQLSVLLKKILQLLDKTV
jgi:hypothetical protein